MCDEGRLWVSREVVGSQMKKWGRLLTVGGGEGAVKEGKGLSKKRGGVREGSGRRVRIREKKNNLTEYRNICLYRNNRL